MRRILKFGEVFHEFLCRPWHRVSGQEYPLRVPLLTLKNYKVYDDLGPTTGVMSRMVTEPNMVRKSGVPPGMEALIAAGPPINIGERQKRPLRTIRNIQMPVRLGRFVALVDFVVCDKLAVPFMLGADFCDRFVEAMYRRKKMVELKDHSQVSIVRKFPSRTGKIQVDSSTEGCPYNGW